MVDTTTQLAAVTRGVQTAVIDGHDTRVQTLSQTYASPIDDVWDAVTSPARIERWFLPVEGELKVGGNYQLIGNAGGTVEECEAPADGRARFRATWEYGGGVSWIGVELLAIDADATVFTLTHLARVADVPAEFWDQFGPGATGVGWDQALLGLALNLRGGDTIAPADAETWMLSEDGLLFARAACDAWAAAQVADGADPVAARRAADATFAFYTTAPEG
ncbi:SRPBCC domain-containing protein [Microbacterium sp. P05]|uniref:SRPBCC domain-containing protein n=1 Tax=Microbacterium sp. P05 TaxID=3366948 RepID=UPI00374701D7